MGEVEPVRLREVGWHRREAPRDPQLATVDDLREPVVDHVHHKLTEPVTVPVTEIMYRNGVTGGLTDRNRG